MADCQICINFSCLSDSERKQLMALVEKANGECIPSNDWEGKKVWYWDDCTDSAKGTQWTGNSWQKNYDSRGMIYATKEEAEEALQRVKYQTMWHRLSKAAGEYDCLWKDGNRHWYVEYDYTKGRISYNYHQSIRSSDIYFPTQPSIASAVAKIGEENVKRYILGVKE